MTRSGIYEAQGSLGSIARDMDEIDALVKRRKRETKIIVICAVLVLLSGFVLTRIQPWIGLPLVVLGGGALYAGFVRDRGTPDAADRVKLVRGLAAMLANDADLKAPATIWMSFDQKGSTLSEAPWPVKKKGKERRASCEWLRLETTLLDGTELTQNITDYFRDRTYVNPRGKSKKKRRVTSVVVQKYKFVADVYGDPAGFPEQIRQLVRLPYSATLRDLRINPKTLTARIHVKVNADLLPACTALSLGAYRILNLSRLVGKGAK
jgi:hypothetical protein